MSLKKEVKNFVNFINEFCLDKKKKFVRPKDIDKKVTDKKVRVFISQKSKLMIREKPIQCKRWKKIKNERKSTCDIERKKIRQFYKDCPFGYEVDHIIPLSKGGTHRLYNLQYLSRYENRVKSGSLSYPTWVIEGKTYFYIPIVAKRRSKGIIRKLNSDIVHKINPTTLTFHNALTA